MGQHVILIASHPLEFGDYQKKKKEYREHSVKLINLAKKMRYHAFE